MLSLDLRQMPPYEIGGWISIAHDYYGHQCKLGACCIADSGPVPRAQRVTLMGIAGFGIPEKVGTNLEI